MKRLHRHQIHQFLLHAPMIWVLNSRLCNETTYLLPLLPIVHTQPFGNIVDPRPLHPSPISLSLHHPLALLIIFDAHQLLIAHHRLNLPELRSIHHLSLQMLLDEFLQVTPPCLLVLFGNEWWTWLSVTCLPGEWLNI